MNVSNFTMIIKNREFGYLLMVKEGELWRNVEILTGLIEEGKSWMKVDVLTMTNTDQKTQINTGILATQVYVNKKVSPAITVVKRDITMIKGGTI